MYRNCLQDQPVFVGTCYVDGYIETDKCAVDFLRGNTGRLFDCEVGDLYACHSKCRRLNCEDKCPTYSKAQAVCASDGKLYMDACRAHCNDSSLDIWFDCDCPLNKEKCAIKCQHMYDEKNCIPHHHIIKEKEVVFMHTPSVHLYHKILQNGDKLDVLDHKMDWNTQINLRQSKALDHQDQALHQVLHNQSHDAMRDWKHMKAHKMAALQRKDIMGQVSANGVGIEDNGKKADMLLVGQEVLKDAHGYTQNQLRAVQGDVLKNQGMIGELGVQVAQHRGDFADHRADFAAHVDAAAVHDAKQDGLIAAHAEHDAKQDALIAAHADHDAKQDGLIADHAQTQAILSQHVEDSNAHVSRQDEFNAEQRAFNAKVDSHMADEKSHMHKQDHEMMAAAHHRSHENYHMAHHGHGYHGHIHPTYVTKTVMKPKKKTVLVLPHGARVQKKTYTEMVPVKKTYEVGHHHHGHSHGHHHHH